MATAVDDSSAGSVHVLSGPDHVAAVTPFALRGGSRAWTTGLRWGAGHVLGVGLLAALALALREVLPLEAISAWSERVVGVVLIAIGLWAGRRALRERIHTHEHEHDGEKHVHVHVHTDGAAHPVSHDHGHALFGVGVLHGLAGTSHFLGVIPALALPGALASVTYLAGYGGGTLLSMSLFSLLVGRAAVRFSSSRDKLWQGLHLAAAGAALAVGIFWLIP
jgi:hypothetical protein